MLNTQIQVKMFKNRGLHISHNKKYFQKMSLPGQKNLISGQTGKVTRKSETGPVPPSAWISPGQPIN